MLLLLISCKGLKSGVGVRGILLKDDLMTLDGDTFNISERIGDSLLVVCSYPADDESCYLLKQERNGFYYVQYKAKSFLPIENTSDFISINENKIYDVRKKKILFSHSWANPYLEYLGEWRGRYVFTDFNSIYFSDGKNITCQEHASCRKSDKNDKVTLAVGAQTKEVSFEELYRSTELYATKDIKDTTISRLSRDYYIKPQNEYENVNAGFYVELDIPKGNSEADKAIRGWMLESIKDDAFSLLDYQKDIPVIKSPTPDEMRTSLDRYGVLWEKLCRNDYQVGDTLSITMTCDINVRKVTDCNDYATYCYELSLYYGGLHEMPRSYYITYDKRRKIFLHASNTIKPSMMGRFRNLALKSLKAQYDLNNKNESTWNDFIQLTFSFNQLTSGISGSDDVLSSLVEHQYLCDEWSGWNNASGKEFTIENFPLPHLAVLPEGIVLSYHRYQIDCFAAGEYHAVIPFKDAEECLSYSYYEHDELLPKLQRFIKLKERR